MELSRRRFALDGYIVTEATKGGNHLQDVGTQRSRGYCIFL